MVEIQSKEEAHVEEHEVINGENELLNEVSNVYEYLWSWCPQCTGCVSNEVCCSTAGKHRKVEHKHCTTVDCEGYMDIVAILKKRINCNS